ncbi:MAG: hypothetical protein ACFUZC_11890 [Chthoniobacteraceae bacterium]
MSIPYAFFDADCLEATPQGALRLHPRARLQPFRKKLIALYKVIRANAAPLVYSTCYGRPMLRPGVRGDILFVPLDPREQAWKADVATHHLFYVHKTYRDPKQKHLCPTYDMFADNGNAADLVRAIDAREWIVFGNGFNLCIGGAVLGILNAGAPRVTFLADVMTPLHGVPSVPPPETVFEQWSKAGARHKTFEQLCLRLARERLQTAA